MKRETYQRGLPGVKWGIWNCQRKCFQFSICEDTVEKYDLTDGNRFLIRHDLQIRLTLYDELDEHYDASWYRLSQETDAVTELLIRGWMVGHRHLKPLLKVLPRDPDRAYVQINLSWMDNRPGLDTGASTPAADAYSVTVRGDIN